MKSNLFSPLALALMAATSFNIVAQNNVYDYDVNHIDYRHSINEARPGEVIVKLKKRSNGSPARVKVSKNGNVSAPSSALESILRDNGIAEAEQLMALTGDKVAPRRARALNGKEVPDVDLSGLYALRFDATKNHNIYSLIEQLEATDDVEYAEPNYIVHTCAEPATDPLYSEQWGPAAIGADKLWEVEKITEKRPIIAILDTGVDIEHPDLADNIWTNPLESDGIEGSDDDGNGFADDIHGWDFVNKSPRMRDNNGHGTHCAGIAAAVGGNGIGIVGANPDALIMPITVLQSNGSGDMATIIKGLDYARANGADVISMSFGSYSHSQALCDALGKAYQKSILVAAAGNDGLCIYQHLCPVNRMQGAPMFPAAYSSVLGVQSSMDEAGTLAGFSNFDEDGPITSRYKELYNYELRAPGTSIVSTFPNGQYRTLHGTSMACPLVAGALSRLTSVKESSSKEELFGDLIYTSKGNVDIFAAYKLTDADRKPTLSLVTYRIDDAKMGDGDGIIDAGEAVRLYPTFRNSWGNARNVTYTLRLAETEDPEIVYFMDKGETKCISNISSYASVEAETPFIFQVSDKCVDGRVICFVLEATCDNISEPLVQDIEFTVENGVEIGGILKEDMTLTADKNYIVTSNLAVPDSVTLTIEAGTTIKFKDDTGLSVSEKGKLIANGTPEKRITFTKTDLGTGRIRTLNFGSYTVWDSNISPYFYKSRSILNYASVKDLIFKSIRGGNWNNSHFTYIKSAYGEPTLFWGTTLNKCTIDNAMCQSFTDPRYRAPIRQINIINIDSSYDHSPVYLDNICNSNIFSAKDLHIGIFYPTTPQVFTPEEPNYLGTSNEATARSRIVDINYPGSSSMGEYDVSNMLKRPVHEAPGMVWKVVVNGYDAQDEYDMLPPLGVGRHKFEVYFNRQMNHSVAPMLAMGIREPYTQTAISEDGEWRSEIIEGDTLDIYTAYLTIRGRDYFDGVNTIYVADAIDDFYFPIPTENLRFHVNVQSAGLMSNGFTAEPGVGKVSLTWENPEENFDDILGYNLYRYTLDTNDAASDTIRINERLLDTEEYIDYDITPGTTYCYYYKVLRTSLTENAPSKVVAATPRAAGMGDANASGNVDVADVVTEVNYMVGANPKPFMFEAADINSDSNIDILDVVATVNIILKPEESTSAQAMATAVYTIENGLLYIDCPIELAGLQVELSGDAKATEISVLDGLLGMETAGNWLNDTDYRFLAFSLSGKTIEQGKHAVLSIGDASIENIMLVDTKGNQVMAMQGEFSGISSVVGQQMLLPYPNPFDVQLNVPVTIATEGTHNVKLCLTNLAGVTLLTQSAKLLYGEHTLTINAGALPNGFYLLTLVVDDKNVQTVRVIKK